MRYLQLSDIKKQCVIEDYFTDDDALLESMGEAAEDYIEQLVNKPLDDIAAENQGELPKSLYHAMLIFVDFLYSTARGSSGTENVVPGVINTMVKLYRSFL